MSTEGGRLVLAARKGDDTAWNGLVDLYGSRVWAVTRAHGLGKADAEDVFQVTFLRLATHIDAIRDPDAVGGWLAVTARHECLRLLSRSGRTVPTANEAGELEPGDDVVPPVDAGFLTAERDAELWRAFAKLDLKCQRLLRVLMADPPPTYREASDSLGMAIGSIGPRRGRCLDHLRQHLGSITDDPDVS